MKKAILRGPRDLVIEDQQLATGELGPHDIWVRTEISGFKIGTDRGNYEGAESMPGAPNEFPRGVGDSSVGVVQRTGAGNDQQAVIPASKNVSNSLAVRFFN